MKEGARTIPEVQQSITDIVTAMNSIRIEELNRMLESANREQTTGPMLDPTRFQGGEVFDAIRQTKKVLQAINDFKYEVSGIGKFNVIHELKGGRQ